jgi:hypothetical protein
MKSATEDLKMKAFQSEFAGKMNFYLSTVDDQLRHADDRPSIGLECCGSGNHRDGHNNLPIDVSSCIIVGRD